MPSLGAVYIRDISGNSALIDSSGSLRVNVIGGLTAGAGVSGNSVNVTSGLVAITSGAWLASGIVVNISGQNVTTTVNTTTNISGQQVYLGSGSNFVSLSGALVSISGAFITSVSGNAVNFASGAQLNLSGVAVFISGGVSTSGSAVTVSGQAVSVSGNYVNIASGSIAGFSGTAIGVSGQTLSIASGVYIASGISVIASVSVSTQSIQSGNIAVLSGSITVNSGTVAVSGLYQGGLALESGIGGISGAIPAAIMAYDLSGAKWNPISTSNSGINVLNVFLASGSASLFSGLNVTVNSGGLALVSGDISVLSGLITLGSGGNTVGTFIAASGVIVASGIMPNISGQAVSVSGNVIQPMLGAPPMTSGFGFSGAIGAVVGMYDFSGQKWIPMSSNISGQDGALTVAQTAATQIRIGFSGTAVQSGLPNLSGGTALQSGDLYIITVRNVSGNSDMYIGGSGSKPFSGFGFVLCGGDAVTMSITNANLVYVYPTVSGQFVKWIGSQF